MRLFSAPARSRDERLLWSRDIRFVNRLAGVVAGAQVVELDSGTVLIAPSDAIADELAETVAADVHRPQYGLVDIDRDLPERDRYLHALAAAVQASGLADRIGMAHSMLAVQAKTLDYFFTLRARHGVAFQPIVDLADGSVHEYECLFRPDMPIMPQSISSIVSAAIDTDRSVELDAFLIETILDRIGSIAAERASTGLTPLRFAVNLTPVSLLDARFEATLLARMVQQRGIEPSMVTIEVTEQQAVADVLPLRRQVKALRRLGFGFAVDDAGAGYASFALIAALRPSIIKIDRDIVHGISRDDAKQALVEAFVSFGRRIDARLVAEGIEKRVDLASLSGLGVQLGQGFLLGRPESEPLAPRLPGPSPV